MVDIKKDRKSDMWTITRTDSEGYHRQLAVSEEEMDELVRLWMTEVSAAIPSQHTEL